MIDLHTHTSESDGTSSPTELLAEAVRIGMEALAITDHDTFSGYDRAAGCDFESSIELICGIELSTRYHGRSVHLPAYFLKEASAEQFRSWVKTLKESRFRRNHELVRELRSKGIDITLEEVAARTGKSSPRPHFAGLMVEKGYVSSVQQAFDEYLDESGACFVPREEPDFQKTVGRILASGRLPVLPHPGRFTTVRSALESIHMCSFGLRGIEVYHSSHSASDIEFYSMLASKLGLAITGGSDFHGATKPGVVLGTGIEGM